MDKEKHIFDLECVICKKHINCEMTNNKYRKIVHYFTCCEKCKEELKELHTHKKYICKCKKCGNDYIINVTPYNYKNGKYKKYCSLQCANSRNFDRNKIKIVQCNQCSKMFETKISSAQKICNDCKKENYLKNKIKKKSYKRKNKRKVFKQRKILKEHVNNVLFCKLTKRNKTDLLCNDCELFKLGYCKKKEHGLKYRLNIFKKDFGLNLECCGNEKEIIKELEKIKQQLYELYIIKKMSEFEIRKFFHLEHKRLNNIMFDFFGIVPRTFSEATNNALLNTEKFKNNEINCSFHKHFKQGIHTTWNNERVYLRSSYEFEYAEYLDNNKIVYEVESLRIPYYDTTQHRIRVAIPDFYLPDTNEIVEIKSDWTLKGVLQNMKDKFNEYIKLGYNPKLILDHKEINIFDISENM